MTEQMFSVVKLNKEFVSENSKSKIASEHISNIYT